MIPLLVWLSTPCRCLVCLVHCICKIGQITYATHLTCPSKCITCPPKCKGVVLAHLLRFSWSKSESSRKSKNFHTWGQKVSYLEDTFKARQGKAMRLQTPMAPLDSSSESGPLKCDRWLGVKFTCCNLQVT